MMPPLMNNHHCYIGSLGQLCRWLAGKAEALGVEIYPGFAAIEVLYDDKGAVRGIATGDMGIAKDGSHKASFTRGMELCGKYTLFAEGARGSLTKQLIAKFALDAKSEPGKFGIGLKEVWQIDPSRHQKGLIQHSFGWPLDNKTGGGSFLYHYDDNLVAVGFVVHLNYDDPYLSPFEEFQRFKTHPAISGDIRGRQTARLWRPRHHRGRLSIGAAAVICRWRADRLRGRLCERAAHQGRSQRDRQRHAGGRTCRRRARRRSFERRTCRIRKCLALVGGGQGPVPRSQHQAVMVEIRHHAGRCARRLRHVVQYAWLLAVRNPVARQARPQDAGPAKGACAGYHPKPDGKLTFDRLSSVFLSNTNHEEDQPVHLKVADMNLQKTSEHDVYAGPSNRYCPAGVYEWAEEATGPRFVINAQNCVHCKTCDIKDPNENITWVPPEGGGGPNYEAM